MVKSRFIIGESFECVIKSHFFSQVVLAEHSLCYQCKEGRHIDLLCRAAASKTGSFSCCAYRISPGTGDRAKTDFAKLKQAGLVTASKKGLFMYYSRKPVDPPFGAVLEVLYAAVAADPAWDSDRQALARRKGC